MTLRNCQEKGMPNDTLVYDMQLGQWGRFARFRLLSQGGAAHFLDGRAETLAGECFLTAKKELGTISQRFAFQTRNGRSLGQAAYAYLTRRVKTNLHGPV
jgi:hypothetical protein